MSTLVLFSTYHSYIGLVLPYITPKYRQCIVAKDSGEAGTGWSYESER